VFAEPLFVDDVDNLAASPETDSWTTMWCSNTGTAPVVSAEHCAVITVGDRCRLRPNGCRGVVQETADSVRTVSSPLRR